MSTVNDCILIQMNLYILTEEFGVVYFEAIYDIFHKLHVLKKKEKREIRDIYNTSSKRASALKSTIS